MQKIQLKISAEEKTKRVKALPDSFKALKTIVEASFFKNQVCPVFNLKYVDADQELINVSDDDDLQTAYEVAEEELQGKLSLQVVPADGQFMALNDTQSEIGSMLNSQRSAIQPVQQNVFAAPAPVKKQEAAPLMQMMEADEEMKEPHQWKPAQKKETEGEDSSSSDSDEEEGEKKKKHWKRKAGHHGFKKQKREKKPLPQHKVIKKLIMRELDRQGPAIIQQVVKESRDSEATAVGDELGFAKVTRHENVVCDGCGIKGIIGIRYKCSVLKDFDFCEICEERLTHAYPFIKIPTPEQAPASIQIELHEGQFKDAQVDHDFTKQETGENPFNVFAQFCHGRDWKQAAQYWMEKQQAKAEKREAKHEGHHHHHRGFGGRGGRGGCHDMPKHFGGLVRNFCENLNEDPQKREEVCKNIGSCINQFVMSAGQGPNAFDDEGPDYRGCNPKRAVCIEKPEVLSVQKGKTVFAGLKIQNQTKYPWREDCYVQAVMNRSPVEITRVVVDRPVKGQDEFEIQVPVALEPMHESSETQWEVTLAFYRNDGKQMGTPFVLKFQEDAGNNEQLKAAATQLSEAQMGSFEECLSALQICGGDEGAALQKLYDAKLKASK